MFIARACHKLWSIYFKLTTIELLRFSVMQYTYEHHYKFKYEKILDLLLNTS